MCIVIHLFDLFMNLSIILCYLYIFKGKITILNCLTILEVVFP